MKEKQEESMNHKTENRLQKKKLNIGGVELPSPVGLAPMAGVTDLPFRILCREQGCGLMCTEMVSAKALLYKNKNTKPLLETVPEEHPLAVQLFGSDPEIMSQMALQLVLHRGVHGGDEVGGPLAAGLGRQLPAGEERAGLTDGGTELIEQQIGQLEHRKAPIDVMPLRRAERSDWRIPLRRGNINRTWWKKAWSCLPPLAFLPPPHYNNQYNQSSAPKSAFASLRRSGQREERASRPDLNG